jgi:hypothetical protein
MLDSHELSIQRMLKHGRFVYLPCLTLEDSGQFGVSLGPKIPDLAERFWEKCACAIRLES